MDQNDKIPNDKMTKLENEIKVLKNEVQAVLLDLRESYLNMENPFNSAANPATAQPIVITERASAREPKPERLPEENQKPEPIKSEKDLPGENSPEPAARKPGKGLSIANNPLSAPGLEISREETDGDPDPPAQLGARPVKSAGPDARKNLKLDLVTMAGLTGWVEQSAKKIGRERTQAVLEISEAMGYVSLELKPILVKLITLAPQSPTENKAGTRDYINSLIKLNSLLGNDNREETALLLLSLVSGDKNDG